MTSLCCHMYRIFIFQYSWRSICGTRTPLCTHRDIWASRSRSPRTPPRLGAQPPQGALLSHPVTHSDVLLCKCVSCYYRAYSTDCGSRYLSRYSDWVRAARSGNRIPVGATFSAPVQTGPGAHPASYIPGTGCLPQG